jgi:hypothetical protein
MAQQGANPRKNRKVCRCSESSGALFHYCTRWGSGEKMPTFFRLPRYRGAGCCGARPGITKSNMTPNAATLDSTPLFQAGRGDTLKQIEADFAEAIVVAGSTGVTTGTAPGVARVTIGGAVGGTLIGTVAPGLFSANGTGSGVAAVLVSADGTQTPVSVFPCSSTGCVSTPMSRGSAGDVLGPGAVCRSSDVVPGARSGQRGDSAGAGGSGRGTGGADGGRADANVVTVNIK